MEIKQLEYFRAIVDEGTISGAARTLHMTQPPLSYQMKMLEEELQVQLFIRGSKKIRLTEAGKALYVRAESLLTMTDITKREVIKVSQATTIHLGVTPSTVHMMTKYLVRYTKNHPDIRFVIHDGSTFILKDGLENGIIDVTTLRTPIALNGFCSKLLAQEPLLAMISREQGIPEYRELTLERNGENVWELVSDSRTQPELLGGRIVILLSELMRDRAEFIGTPTELSAQIDPVGSEGITPKKVSRLILQSVAALSKIDISAVVRRSNGKRLIELRRAESDDAQGTQAVDPIDPVDVSGSENAPCLPL